MDYSGGFLLVGQDRTTGRRHAWKGQRMIQVTRFNGLKFYINAELIQTVEGTPDTVITLVNEVKIVVKDKPDLVVDRIIAYQQKVRNPVDQFGAGD
jgi:flagellar protein FlbD